MHNNSEIVRATEWFSFSQEFDPPVLEKGWRLKLPSGLQFGRDLAGDRLFLFAKKRAVHYCDLEERECHEIALNYDDGARATFGDFVCFSTVQDGVRGVSVINARSLESSWSPLDWTSKDPLFYDSDTGEVLYQSGCLNSTTSAHHAFSVRLVGTVIGGKHYGPVIVNGARWKTGCFDIHRQEMDWNFEPLRLAIPADGGALFAATLEEKIPAVERISIEGERSGWRTTLPDHVTGLTRVASKVIAFGNYTAWVMEAASGELLATSRRGSSNHLVSTAGSVVWENRDNELVHFDAEQCNITKTLQMPKASYSELSSWNGRILRRSGSTLHCVD